MIKKILLVIAAAILAYLGYQTLWGEKPRPYTPITKVVEVETVSAKRLTKTIKLIGTIQAKRSTYLVAQESGILKHTNPAGKKLNKGDIIAAINNPDIEKGYLLAKNLEKIAKTNFDRQTALFDKKLASARIEEEARNAFIESQRASALAKINYDKTLFTAPFDGVIGMYKVREGSFVQTGDNIGIFYDPSELIIEFDISASILKHLSDKPSIQVDGRSFIVSNLQRMINPETNMVTVYADYRGKNSIIGSTIALEFLVVDIPKTITIPTDAVFLKENKPMVYLVKDGKAKLTPVTKGVLANDRLEIRSGIQEGDKVIIFGQSRLFPDEAVQIHQEPKA